MNPSSIPFQSVYVRRDVQLTHLDLEALNDTQKSAAYNSQIDSIRRIAKAVGAYRHYTGIKAIAPNETWSSVTVAIMYR